MSCCCCPRKETNKEKALSKLILSKEYDNDGTTGEYFKNSHGLLVTTREFFPPNNVPHKAIAFLFHGLGGHVHRRVLTRFARQCNEEGIIFLAPDMEGHGLSQGLRGHISSYQSIVKDCLMYIQHNLHRFPNLPFFVVGESMGGSLSILTGLKLSELAKQAEEEKKRVVNHDDNNNQNLDHSLSLLLTTSKFSGACLVAPAIDNSLEPPACMVWLLRKFVPCCPTSRLICVPNIPAEDIWRDPEQRQLEIDDPLGDLNGLRLGTAAEVLDMTHEVQHRMTEVDFPFIIVHGTEDRIVPISGSYSLLKKSRTADQDKLMKVFDGCYHDVLGDPVCKEAALSMLGWMLQRLPQQQQ